MRSFSSSDVVVTSHRESLELGAAHDDLAPLVVSRCAVMRAHLVTALDRVRDGSTNRPLAAGGS